MERSHKAQKTEAFHQTDLEKHCCKTFFANSKENTNHGVIFSKELQDSY